MRAVVAYESMYGNTRRVAEAIAAGLQSTCSVTLVPVSQLERESLDTADLIVIGGPTHVRGMSRMSTRKAAEEAAHKPGSTLAVEADAQAPGLREWLTSRGIAKELRRHGVTLLTQPESFLVSKDNQLLPGEEDRARIWGQQLARTVAGAAHSSKSQES